MGERRCVFCGGVGPLTREDVLALWMRPCFPGLDSLTATGWIGPAADEEATFSYRDGVPYLAKGPDRRDLPAVKDLGLIARAVCSGCNSGWMADVEAVTQPVLGPMIDGQPVLLIGRRAENLATWR